MTDYTNLLERLAVSAGDQECLYADAKAAIEALQTRVAEAENTNNALRVRLGSELERANERLVDLEFELYSYADVPRERLEESRRMDELKLRVTRLEAELAAERAAPEPIQCETCQGTGKINETLGGYGFSDPSATCPDCDGSGEIESIHDFRASQWWVKELDGILGSPSPDVTPDRKRAVAVVHNLLRHVANLGQVTVTTDESGRAVAVTRQDDDHRILSVIWEAPPVAAPVRLTDAEMEAERDKQEPVAWCIDGEDGREYNGTPKMSGGRIGTPLYAAPPVITQIEIEAPEGGAQ